jgi:hypothetical protein
VTVELASRVHREPAGLQRSPERREAGQQREPLRHIRRRPAGSASQLALARCSSSPGRSVINARAGPPAARPRTPMRPPRRPAPGRSSRAGGRHAADRPGWPQPRSRWACPHCPVGVPLKDRCAGGRVCGVGNGYGVPVGHGRIGREDQSPRTGLPARAPGTPPNATGQKDAVSLRIGRWPPDDAEAVPRRPPLRLANRPARAREAPDLVVRGLPTCWAAMTALSTDSAGLTEGGRAGPTGQSRPCIVEVPAVDARGTMVREPR